MKNLLTKLYIAILFSMVILGMSFVGGCERSEAGKAVTDMAKKVIGDEVVKQGNEVKKQIDQIINVGSKKGEKEGEGNAAGEPEKGSTKESQEGSGEEKD